MDVYTKRETDFKPLTNLAKKFSVDVQLGSEYPSGETATKLLYLSFFHSLNNELQAMQIF